MRHISYFLRPIRCVHQRGGTAAIVAWLCCASLGPNRAYRAQAAPKPPSGGHANVRPSSLSRIASYLMPSSDLSPPQIPQAPGRPCWSALSRSATATLSPACDTGVIEGLLAGLSPSSSRSASPRLPPPMPPSTSHRLRWRALKEAHAASRLSERFRCACAKPGLRCGSARLRHPRDAAGQP